MHLRTNTPIRGLFQIVCLVRTKIKTCFWWLVVSHVLCRHGKPIRDVVHQAVDAVGGRDGGGVDAEFREVLSFCPSR